MTDANARIYEQLNVIHEEYVKADEGLTDRYLFYMDIGGWTHGAVLMMVIAGIMMCSCEPVYVLGIVTIVYPIVSLIVFTEVRRRAANEVYFQLLCVLLLALCSADFITICAAFHDLGMGRKKGWGPTAGVLAAILVTCCAALFATIFVKSIRHHKNPDAVKNSEV
ncbi:putative transmembrane protein [Gregarina niphandrodes]|uniref:Transmembrane protein n=1 Tax=Gregarina niphandrodes TaxID=110365 RepID=A0A023B398_GRENI|nr:putative transmembrane protein [Gregarina niphandrodes]EZG55423.1 putative transmembrane protein [Gregarina niphandrodes]|eukprot:XP_011131563.1 putative transmembrane protein [Gregarina niphandrodes]